MEQILYYLLKVSIATAVLFATYFLLFRTRKQFVFNRIYLAGSFLAAFILPLITFSSTSQLSRATTYLSGNINADWMISETSGTETATFIGLATILAGLYGFGLCYFLVKLINAYIVACIIRKRCTKKSICDLEVWISEDNNRAFTFLDKIIIGKNLLHHPSLGMVLNHEAVHSREKHFYDIILAEILLLLQWFNPFAWSLTQAIRNNLEFRADDVVIQASDKKEYQLTMLAMSMNGINSSLFTALNSSNLKKRIIMMNAKKQNQFAGIVRLAIIPIIALLLVSLSGKNHIIVNESGLEGDIIIHSSNTMGKKQNDPIKSEEEMMKYLSRILTYPSSARSAGQIGSVRLYATVNPDGTIREVREALPIEQFVKFEEMVIVGYTGNDSGKIKKTKSAKHESLLEEGKRVINSFPKLEIPELQGGVVEFVFRFELR